MTGNWKMWALPMVALLGACATGPTQQVAAEPASTPAPKTDTITILIAIDGFRADYLDRGITPNLKALADGGARAAMRPSFPSVTIANYYTLMTGKRPDHHGVIGNEFESETKRVFAAVDPATGQSNYWDPSWWNGALPLWASIEAAGGKTALFFYPGPGVDGNGQRPANYRRYTTDIAPADEPAEFLKWLDGPAADLPRFLTLYFIGADNAGHDHGPNSPQLNAALREIDGAIGTLLAGLQQRGLRDRTNLVIISDHGMAEIAPTNDIILDDLLPVTDIRPVSLGAYATIEPAASVPLDKVAQKLVGRHGPLECWRKSEVPARYGFGRHPRVAPIVCLADSGWNITTRAVIARRKTPRTAAWGNHGFDPAHPDMAALFIGNGPAFRPGIRLASFDNPNIYFLLAALTGTTPEPGDGSVAPFEAALKK